MKSYSHFVARIASAKILDFYGFEAVQDSALDTLSDILCQILRTISLTVHNCMEHAGRTLINLNDVLMAFDLIELKVFEISDFLVDRIENPKKNFKTFFPLIPSLEHIRDQMNLSFINCGEKPPDHIQRFFPSLPDVHICHSSPTIHKKEAHRQRKNVLAIEKFRSAVKALTKLSNDFENRKDYKQYSSRWNQD